MAHDVAMHVEPVPDGCLHAPTSSSTPACGMPAFLPCPRAGRRLVLVIRGSILGMGGQQQERLHKITLMSSGPWPASSGPLAGQPVVGAGGQVGEPGCHQRVVRQHGPGRLPGGRAAGRAIVGCG
jgi:hypothetical protein